MARPKSNEKKQAILNATLTVFAQRGFWSTPTSEISKAAGVSEGTLFTYFKTKDDLMNELFCELKKELYDAVMTNFPKEGDIRTRVQELWNRHIDWGVSNPDKNKVLAQLDLSESITEDSKKLGNSLFAESEKLLLECREKGIMRDYPDEMVGGIIMSLIETTITLILRNKDKKEVFCKAGFDAFWSCLAKCDAS